MKENNADELLFKIRETINKLLKAPRKIKMKEDIYNKIATEAQEQAIIEILDVNKQPLNTLFGVKIEIDNSIEKDWEVL